MGYCWKQQGSVNAGLRFNSMALVVFSKFSMLKSNFPVFLSNDRRVIESPAGKLNTQLSLVFFSCAFLQPRVAHTTFDY